MVPWDGFVLFVRSVLMGKDAGARGSNLTLPAQGAMECRLSGVAWVLPRVEILRRAHCALHEILTPSRVFKPYTIET